MKSTSIVLLSTLVASQIVGATKVEPRSWHLPMSARAAVAQTVEERTFSQQNRLDRMRRKYNIVEEEEILPKSTRGKAKRVKGTVQMADAYSDSSYSATIVLGTPPVAFQVSLDTGSADLIVVTDPCLSGCDSSTPLYRPTQSSSSLVSSTDFSIAYTSGGASGYLVSDKMSFGGYSMSMQTFAAVNKSSTITGAGGVNGLLGLGLQPLANSEAIPFVQALYLAGMLPAPLFAFAFARWGNVDSRAAVNPGGIMSIGSVDTRFFSGAINYVKVTNTGIRQGYWLVPMDDMTFGGVSLGISSIGANIDTGTTNMLLPVRVANEIYARIPGSITNGRGVYIYPCATVVSISLTFGGITYPILPDDFNGGYASEDGLSCFGTVNAIGQAAGGADVFIIGDAFLKNVYSVYRFNPFAVGFAPLVNTNGLVESGFVPVGNATNALGQRVPQPATDPNTGTSASGGVSVSGLAQVLQNAVTATIAINVRNGVISITCPTAKINKSVDVWTCNP